MQGILSKLKTIIKALTSLNLKTFIINIRYLRLKDACKFPILVYSNVVLSNIGGKVIINSPLRYGMIKIGCNDIGIFDKKRSRSIWDIKGTIIFNGSAKIGHGAKINIWKDAVLYLGDKFEIAAESTLCVTKEIRFGSGCLLSWDVLLMDSDLHDLLDDNREKVNMPDAITIGDRVWIGCRSTILKGTVIGDNTVIGANSVCTNKTYEGNCVLAGNPAKKIRMLSGWKI